MNTLIINGCYHCLKPLSAVCGNLYSFLPPVDVWEPTARFILNNHALNVWRNVYSMKKILIVHWHEKYRYANLRLGIFRSFGSFNLALVCDLIVKHLYVLWSLIIGLISTKLDTILSVCRRSKYHDLLKGMLISKYWKHFAAIWKSFVQNILLNLSQTWHKHSFVRYWFIRVNDQLLFRGRIKQNDN